MDPSFWQPEQASTLASKVDRAFHAELGLSALVLVVVLTSIVVAARRNDGEPRGGSPNPSGPGGIGGGADLARGAGGAGGAGGARGARGAEGVGGAGLAGGPGGQPTKLSGSARALRGLIALALGTALGALYLFGLAGFVDAAVAPGDALEIGVTADKGHWAFSYPDDAKTDDELRVPEGRPVRLTMTSKDLPYSFFVPELRIQREVVPSATSTAWFEATQPGELAMACPDYGCAEESPHGKVLVMEDRAFKEWLDRAGGGKNLPPAEYGRKLYAAKTCIVCHSLDGTRIQGPTFKNVWGRTEELEGGGTIVVDSAYVRESILKPQAKIVKGYPPVMPSLGLSDEEISAIEAFLKTVH